MAKIKTKLLQKNFTSSPRRISPAITTLCNEINPSESPALVEVRPQPNAIHSECFHNVMEHVEENGGRIIFGWTIWEWPRVFIEAEHHAVSEKNGELVDVTPKREQGKENSFLA